MFYLLKRILIVYFLLFSCHTLFAQEIALYQQFNGRYDYLAIGNTLNLAENGVGADCTIMTQNSDYLDLQPSQTVVAAYLYWAGSGTGDFDVLLNNTPIIATRTFSYNLDATHTYFAAFADVTPLVLSLGETTYNLSDLDLTNVILDYCDNGTNFGGWSIIIIYEDPSLTLNQVNVFDGLESVSGNNNSLTIELTNLNVLDNTGAKIGFLAWEGDAFLAVNETLRINGNILSNPPLNPADNAFNGTNSFTNYDQLYNMDIDFYNIENNISPGDTSATIQLTSGQDLVMINNIVTVLNTELPDATILFDTVDYSTACGERDVTVQYTVQNINATAPLPAGTPIAFYANNTLVGQNQTQNEIAIDGFEAGSIILTIPNTIPDTFDFKGVVDDTGSGNGIVTEILEDNNDSDIVTITLFSIPEIIGIYNMETCDVVGIESFDLSEVTLQINPLNTITFHLTEDDAINNVNPIADPQNFINTINPQTIFVRVDNGNCFDIAQFTVTVEICLLPDAIITIENELNACRLRELIIDYKVENLGTAPLPALTPIALYIDNQLIAQSQTQSEIAVNNFELGSIQVFLDESFSETFTIQLVVDDQGDGVGVVEELDETNNIFETNVAFSSINPIPDLPTILLCNQGFDSATFDLTTQNDLISADTNNVITFFTNEVDALDYTNPIENPSQYSNTSNPQTIFVRLDTDICFTIASFIIAVENCEPWIPEGFSPNGDGINDVFEISNILNIYFDFNLKIYSRDGNLIYEGGNEEGFWNGIPNTGILVKDNIVPAGLYYYVLYLNDAAYPNPFTGSVYINY